MLEAGVVIGLNFEPLHWHLPVGRSSVYLPDDRNLWEVFWGNRKNILGFAHTHPGQGIPGPSVEDLTTFRAIERGLGQILTWWIFSENRGLVLRFDGTEYRCSELVHEPLWARDLRLRSLFPPTSPEGKMEPTLREQMRRLAAWQNLRVIVHLREVTDIYQADEDEGIDPLEHRRKQIRRHRERMEACYGDLLRKIDETGVSRLGGVYFGILVLRGTREQILRALAFDEIERALMDRPLVP